jgi:hypothetical protein
MKLPRLRTLAAAGTVAGTLVGATLVLAAPQASAMPMEDFRAGCSMLDGTLRNVVHFEFDVNGNPAGWTVVATCRVGGQVIWNDTDVHGNDY